MSEEFRNSSPLHAFDTFLGCWNYNTQMHLWRYVFAKQYIQNSIVLDIASGVGYGTRYLAESGAKAVYGVDLDSSALSFARHSYSTKNIQYIHGNGLSLPFDDGSIDVAVSFETIEHVPVDYQEAFIAEIHRVIKPQGVFICSSLNHEVSPGHVDHTREFLPYELFGLIGRHFGQVIKYGQFISRDDFTFQRSQMQKLSFQIRRRRGFLLRRVGNWFKAKPERVAAKQYIKQVLRKGETVSVRKPVYITDTLVSQLAPQYAPKNLSEDIGAILFDPVAIGIK